MAEAERSRAARTASEGALARVVHHYGARPEFVVLGGLVPEMLSTRSAWRHAGTTDVDVQVDLEVACGAVNTARLETALRNAEFEPDTARVWRWIAEETPTKTFVKFELLADLDTKPNEATVRFDACESLGAVNLRGTGFASRDVEVRTLTAKVGGDLLTVEVNVTGLAGFLLAKVAAAKARRTPKDWYDIAFVLLHNDRGGPQQAADVVREMFAADLVGAFARRSTIFLRTSPHRAIRDRAPTPNRCTWTIRSSISRRSPPTPCSASRRSTAVSSWIAERRCLCTEGHPRSVPFVPALSLRHSRSGYVVRRGGRAGRENARGGSRVAHGLARSGLRPGRAGDRPVRRPRRAAADAPRPPPRRGAVRAAGRRRRGGAEATRCASEHDKQPTEEGTR